ncbi:unnamed protein product [Allacma fusca]|uniref:Uncharacterized protein n=1 Tax=Allacma fusca TaxID=39272 RepID=A0A8J2LSL4_9HEXA|nr:unnamed protein product [Allacma fusca]
MDAWTSSDHLHELMHTDDATRSMLPLSPVIKKEDLGSPFSPGSPSDRPLCSPTMSTTMSSTTAHLPTEMEYSNGGCGFSTASTSPKSDLMSSFRPVDTSGMMSQDSSSTICITSGRRKSGYESSSSPDSPDRHFCSSTTQSNGDLNHSRVEVNS